MLKRTLVIFSLILPMAVLCVAQNANTAPQNSNTATKSTRTRTVAPKPSPTPKASTDPEAAPATTPQSQRPKTSATPTAGQAGPSTAVLAAFEKIIDGVRRADVDLATNGYWNSSALVLFNYDGSITKGWTQMRKNREESYPNVKDGKLEYHDRHVVMLGRDGAVVMCLWTQSRMFKGQPDTASGRMTLVFKRVGTEWKAVHLHTSPDRPDPTRVPASEQTKPAP